jgi:NADH-quinone oxidoreductase subunit M
MIIVGSWEKYPFQVVVAVFGIVLTAAYMFKMMRGLFYGKLDPEFAHATDAKNWIDRMPLLLLIACSIILGLFPVHFYEVVQSTVEPMIDRINQVAPLVTQNTQDLFP